MLFARPSATDDGAIMELCMRRTLGSEVYYKRSVHADIYAAQYGTSSDTMVMHGCKKTQVHGVSLFCLGFRGGRCCFP